MKHRIFGKKLGRDQKGRKALFRSLATSLIHHGSIETTLAKAKAIQPIVEKLVTKAKKDSQSNYRLIHSFLRDSAVTRKLIRSVAPLFPVSSGYTRIQKISVRRGDAVPVVRLEWVKKNDKTI